MGFGQQHDEHPKRTEGKQETHCQAEPGAVLLAVVVADPHQHGTTEERNEGQEGATTLAQGRAVDHQQGQRQQRQYHRTNGQHAPLRNRHHRAFEVELLLARGVEYAPVGANGTFVADFPRLVKRFDHEVVETLAIELVDQGSQVDRLVCWRSIGAAAHAAIARPAHFGQQQRLFREHLFQVAGAVEDELPGLVHRDEFPVRQDVRGDQVDVLGQFRVFFPDVPLLGRGHRHLHGGADTIEHHAQFGGGDFLAEDRFVADHHTNHAARRVGDFDGAGNFPFVAFLVRTDPDPQCHPQTKLFRQFRDVLQGAIDRVDADVIRQLAHDLQVATHLIVGRVLVFLRELALLEWRVREAGDLFRPVGGGDRAVDQRPEAGKQGRDGEHHDQVESKFTR
ncbi:hypothetical protein D3C73_620730 [compost metagenome]